MQRRTKLDNYFAAQFLFCKRWCLISMFVEVPFLYSGQVIEVFNSLGCHRLNEVDHLIPEHTAHLFSFDDCPLFHLV